MPKERFEITERPERLVAGDSVTLKCRCFVGEGVFYCLRVTQADGEMAWASPVWVDPA